MRIQFVTLRLRAPRLHIPADLAGKRRALLACVGVALLSHGLPVAAGRLSRDLLAVVGLQSQDLPLAAGRLVEVARRLHVRQGAVA
jgi:hypothetical protein